ncbi:MAG: PEGA domain-containing protein [Candidatus Saccharicenans sp.]|mgnify:CR=1 FL=1|nr:PEGA domain-containing protein [Candidatus Saccharicenans sp.]NMC65319.1 PEGA domain-containing protein [Acidobacteriota bacterium]
MRRQLSLLPAVTLTAALVVSWSCWSINQDIFQNVPATSQPTGVNVMVDGRLVGKTPINLKLDREAVHAVRFEAEGYRPVEIQITQRRPPMFETMLKDLWLIPVGGVVMGTPIYLIWRGATGKFEELGEMGRGMASFAAGGLISWIVGSNLDRNRASNSILEPQTLHVEMEKAQAGEAAEVIQIERKNLQSIRWIRIATK